MRIVPESPARGEPPLGVLFGLVLCAGAGLAWVWSRFHLPTPICLFHEWTGLPCPGCGTTRMVAAVLRGDLLAAAAWNPLAFLALSAVAGWAVLSTGRWALGLPPRRLAFDARERMALRVLACGAIVAGWAWLLWRGV